MKQDDVKYVYEINSTLDLDDTIECLFDELNVDFAKLQYFSLSKDDIVTREMKKDELIEDAVEVYNNNELPSVIFPDVEIVVMGDSEINIISKIKLELNGIEVDNIVRK